MRFQYHRVLKTALNVFNTQHRRQQEEKLPGFLKALEL
jgi:hypothetical protein